VLPLQAHDLLLVLLDDLVVPLHDLLLRLQNLLAHPLLILEHHLLKRNRIQRRALLRDRVNAFGSGDSVASEATVRNQ
jgi:hypothetical protein